MDTFHIGKRDRVSRHGLYYFDFVNLLRLGILIVLFFYFLMGTNQVSAQENNPPSRLKGLIQEAVVNNPEIQAMRAEWQAAKLRVPQASALPDPMVGYTVMGPMLETRLGPQEEAYEFEQVIPFPGKLFEKRKIASSQARLAEAQLNRAKRDLILKVSETYFDFYAARANLETLEEVYDLLLNFARAAESFYATLKGPQQDVNKAQIEVTEVLQKKLLLRQQKQSLLEMLSVLVNRDIKEEEIQSLPVLHVPNQPLELDELISRARQIRPELNEAAAAFQAAQHTSRLSKYEYAPDISVGFQYFEIGGGGTSDPDDGQDAWMIPIKFTIPLWQNRIVPAVNEARENLRASRARLKDAENLSVYEVKNAFYRFTASKEIVDLYEKVLLPQAELALRSEIAGYETDKTNFIDLIDRERVYLNAQIAYHQALADSLKSFAALERTVGFDLEDENE